MLRRPPDPTTTVTLFPYTTLFRSIRSGLEAKELGAAALLVTPVFYHGATDQENYLFYREVGEKVQLPVIIYNVIPTNPISPLLFQRIAALDWMAGIKQVNPIQLAEIAARSEERRVGKECVSTWRSRW